MRCNFFRFPPATPYLVFCGLSLFAFAACSSGGGGDDSGQTDGSSVADDDTGESSSSGTSRSLTAATYNVGLLPSFTALTDERVEPLRSALAGFSSDILCIQEAWRPSDRAALISGLQANYPEIFEAATRQKFTSKSPACTFEALEPVATCLVQSCLFSDRGFTECAIAECKSSLDRLAADDPECAGALFAQSNRSAAEADAVLQELFATSAPAGLFAFDGANGLLLASRFPLNNRQVLDFYEESTTSHRVALLASVTVDGVTHQVGCTHLTSNLDGLVPYTGNYGSWQNEGNVQADLLLAAVSARSASQPTVLLGDFNCSIANGQTGVAPDFQANCERILNAGYRDIAGEELGCSFCTSNSLNAANPNIAGTRNLLLDHAFTRNFAADPTLIELALQQPVSAGGTQTNLSDHYAVRITLPIIP